MFIERRINPGTHAVELWQCEWENATGRVAKKVYLGKVGEEQPLAPEPAGAVTEASAIAGPTDGRWATSRYFRPRC
jgi:hypothetical protein